MSNGDGTAEIEVTETQWQELAATACRRLNIGSGDAPMMFWTNLDADESIAADIHAHVPPLPFGDESLDEIYCGHMVEHLSRTDAMLLMAECYRCLAPGGRLGVLVPDTMEIMRRYVAQAIDAAEFPYRVWHKIADLDDVCAMFLYSTVQPSPHRWSYDKRTLARLIAGAGFERLAERDRYTDPRIACGAFYQILIDGYKSGPAPVQAEAWPETFDDVEEELR